MFGRYGFWVINMLYAGIIIPSAIWIYLTFAMIENPNPLLWITIRLVLFTVGFSSVALLASFFTSNFDRSSWLYFASIISLIFFCIQTMLLDALIWPYYYPK
jgi:ABC-type multidrug transport system permease subunit